MREKFVVGRIIADARKHWPEMMWVVVLMMLSGILKSVLATLWGQLIDAGVNGEIQKVIVIGVTVLGGYAFEAMRLAIYNIEAERVIGNVFLDIKSTFFSRLAQAPMKEFDRRIRAGDAVERVSGNLGKLQELFSETYMWLTSTYLQGIIALICCLFICWQLALVYVLLLPLLTLLMNKVGTHIKKDQSEAASYSGKAYSLLNEVINNLSTVKAYRAENDRSARYSHCVDAQTKALIQSEFREMKLTIIAYLGDIFLLAIIFLNGIIQIQMDAITIGQLAAFVTLTGTIRTAFELIGRGIASIREGSALAERIYEIIDLESEFDQPYQNEKPIDSDVENAVEFKNVFFQYGEDSVLKGISLQLKKNSRIALIGESGCGKSTIIKLICKFYTNYSGEITILGHELKSLSCEYVRKHISVVSQDIKLFSGTISDNICYGYEGASVEEIEDILRRVELYEFVSNLPQGINTPIGDYGSRLSGGQKQRLALARALIHNSDIVILDEVTSSLDLQTEANILNMMCNFLCDKSVIIITHRLTALKDVDHVYYMKDGQIIHHGEK